MTFPQQNVFTVTVHHKLTTASVHVGIDLVLQVILLFIVYSPPNIHPSKGTFDMAQTFDPNPCSDEILCFLLLKMGEAWISLKDVLQDTWFTMRIIVYSIMTGGSY